MKSNISNDIIYSTRKTEGNILDFYDQVSPVPMDSKTQKLIILYVFEQMSIPLAEATVLDICSSDNNWLTYMECKQYLSELVETNLIYKVPKSETLNITQDGISCLSLFFTRVPNHIREEIKDYAKNNRLRYKRRQSYFCDYSKNADGSYTVLMKINNDSSTLMEMKLVVANRQVAKYIYKSWVDKASKMYEQIHETLID